MRATLFLLPLCLLRATLCLLIVLESSVASCLHADEGILPPPGPAQRLPLLLRKLDNTHRVLYVTAHPDDEDAGLIARLVHGEGVELTLLTLTRGNGGQNEIGPELHGAIAALRTAELESAHRWDGANQWFGSASDFGYSFSVEETYEIWGEERMLRELVEAIRLYQPDVILTMPPDGPGGGQHHQASSQLTERAMEIAAEETWPDLGAPHATQRLFTVLWGDTEVEHVCEVDLSTVDPLLGASYAEVGTRSRSMHKCQGMVRIEPPLPRRKARLAMRFDRDKELRVLDDPLSGVVRHPLVRSDLYRQAVQHWSDVTEGGVHRGERHRIEETLGWIYDQVRAALDEESDSAALRTLDLRVREAIELQLGIRRRAVTPAPFHGSLGGTTVTVASEFPGADEGKLFEFLRVRVSISGWPGWGEELPAHPRGEPRQLHTVTLPPEAGSSLLDGPVLGEIPAAPGAVLLTGTLEIAGRNILLVPRPVVAEWRDETFPTLRQCDLHIVPDPSLRPARRAEVAPRTGDDAARAHGEFLVSSLVPGTVTVELLAKDDRWTIEPQSIEVTVPGNGAEISVPWTATAPEGSGTIETHVLGHARHHEDPRREPGMSSSGYRRIEYPHIRTTALLEAAAVRVVRFDVSVVPRTIGYVAGVGDAIPRAIGSLGHELTKLTAEDLAEGDLSRFETIVLGVRAYKVRDDLRTHHARLMEWVSAGGTLVVQYHKFEFNADDGTSPYVPYPGAVVGRGRVTDELAPAVVNGSGHPLLATPNRIGAPDWRNWVQERGLYFLDVSAGAPYADILVFEDPFPYNAGPKFGSLVETEVGEGRWIYVGLGLWRQCPAGVPGAYRLLANLLAR